VNTPPLLLGLTLLFWGWQTGFLAVGAVMGVLIETPRFLQGRWNFSQPDFDRLWNLVAILFAGTGLYLFINEGSISWNDFLVDAGRRPEALREKGRAALTWFQWFPMIFFPFAVATAFADNPNVDASTFSWFLRRRRHTRERLQSPSPPNQGASSEEGNYRLGGVGDYFPRVNVAFPYFAVAVFSATATVPGNRWFYVGLCVLVGAALWSQRTRRYPALLLLALFAGAAVAGHFSHLGIARLEKAVEEMNVTWLSRFINTTTDVKQARTRMGSIGSLMLSDRIVLRLRTDGQPPPALLREASYNSFRRPQWFNTHKEKVTRILAESTNSSTWFLQSQTPQNPPRRRVTIGCYLPGGNGSLALPTGASLLDNLPASELERNPLGLVRTRFAPGVAVFDAAYDERSTFDAPPDAVDILESDEPAIDQVANELGLTDGMDPRTAMQKIAVYFATRFSYTSYLSLGHRATSNETELARFLLHERTGHCEYFAAATTLLLRKAGVPARYAIGYAVQEGRRNKYVVRQRHGHAWTLAYYNGLWHDFDTTPGSWNSIEARHSSWLQPINDLFSDAWFQLSKWRWSSTDWRKYLLWIPAPVALIALASFFLKKQWRHIRPAGRKRRGANAGPGLDSELYDVERALAARGFDRHPAETWQSWRRRVEQQSEDKRTVLDTLVALHCKYRFDPAGLTPNERAALTNGAQNCLRELKRRR